MVQTFHGITHQARHTVDSIFRPDYDNLVAHLHAQVTVGKKIHSGTGNTRHIHPIDRTEMQLSESLAVHLRLSYHNALRHHRHVLHIPVDIFFRSDKSTDSFRVVFGTCNEQVVAQIKLRILGRDTYVAFMQGTRTNIIASQEITHLQKRLFMQGRVRDLQGHFVRFGMRIFRLLRQYTILFIFQHNSADITNRNGCSNNTYHSEGIGASISRSYLRNCLSVGKHLGQSFRRGT